MNSKERIESQVAQLLAPVLERHGVRLWDIEYVKEGKDWFLRLTIDKDGGVDISDCEAVSREANELLDQADLIKNAYTFEVSSPGLTRPLRRPNDFKNSLGRPVDVKLFKEQDGNKEFTAVLADYQDGTVRLTLEDESSLTVNVKDIAQIRLSFVE